MIPESTSFQAIDVDATTWLGVKRAIFESIVSISEDLIEQLRVSRPLGAGGVWVFLTDDGSLKVAMTGSPPDDVVAAMEVVQ